MNDMYVPVKNQKFDIGRTINFAKCDCKECDFLHCPKNNYAVKMKKRALSVADFFEDEGEEITKINAVAPISYKFSKNHKLVLTYDTVFDMFDYLQLSFPKGTYWGVESETVPSSLEDKVKDAYIPTHITLIKFSRRGEEIVLGSIRISDGKIWEHDFTERQYKLAQKIAGVLNELQTIVVRNEKDKKIEDWNCGWLSPTGEFFPCKSCEHSKLAALLEDDEVGLESGGWCKIIDDDLYMNSIESRLTAEQRNWLSLRGYDVDDND